ncbi:SDR family oxidoreductase [Actinomycetes bacterium M1A6_2h]
MDNSSSYAGKRVVVTGFASGVGAATATKARELGAHVIGLDIVEASSDVAHEVIRIDLRSPESIVDASDRIGNGVDAAFLCAGVSAGAGLPMRDVFNINYTGTRLLTDRLLPKLADSGALAFVSSLAALRYRDNRTTSEELVALDWEQTNAWIDAHPDEISPSRTYSLSKEAIIWYALSLVARLSPRRIRVNSIAPGPTDTPFLDSTLAREESRKQLETIPQLLGKRATPQQQADALIYLNSGAASIVNGQVLWTDGGYRGAVAAGGIEPAMGEAPRYV